MSETSSRIDKKVRSKTSNKNRIETSSKVSKEKKKETSSKESSKKEGFRLTERDYKIIREIDRWQVCVGRHIKELAGFSGQRACDRRLRKLIEAGFIERRKIIYGLPGIYRNKYKAKTIEYVINTDKKIRIEHITHDITVLNTAIYINKTGIPFETMTTERQLHSLDGFGVRKHRPDFIYTKDGKTICVEVELTLKARPYLEKNIKANFTAYDKQIWVVPDLQSKIARILEENARKYPPIEILEISEVKKYE